LTENESAKKKEELKQSNAIERGDEAFFKAVKSSL